ncbi:helix-turn-helix transcriptional regulator [Pollutibacter soli]|uniref:helix-turn-helix transcriptional regulator n=1 Tax=Pollutibacter soli TaxID=3034157 RepID=UPI0030141188
MKAYTGNQPEHLSSFYNPGNAISSGFCSQFNISGLDTREHPALTETSNRNSKLAVFELYWIKHGNATLILDGGEHPLSKNHIYCISPGHCRLYYPEPGLEGFYISFSPEFIRIYSAGITVNSFNDDLNDLAGVISVNTEPEMHAGLDTIAQRMLREFTNDYNRKTELLRALLNVFLLYFSRNQSSSSNAAGYNRETELVRKFLQLLRKNFTSTKMVSDYASILCVTPNYLNRTVKRTTGLTASQHIQRHIISEAKKQARSVAVSMKEIAYNLGFDNIAHFSKFFKINCGMNFTDYKRQQLAEMIAS